MHTLSGESAYSPNRAVSTNPARRYRLGIEADVGGTLFRVPAREFRVQFLDQLAGHRVGERDGDDPGPHLTEPGHGSSSRATARTTSPIRLVIRRSG